MASAGKHDIKGAAPAEAGRSRIARAHREMPALQLIREGFTREKPPDGIRISACTKPDAKRIGIDRLTAAQTDRLRSWQEGT